MIGQDNINIKRNDFKLVVRNLLSYTIEGLPCLETVQIDSCSAIDFCTVDFYRISSLYLI